MDAGIHIEGINSTVRIERDSLISLFVSEYPRLVRTAVLLLGDRPAAEDVVQEAFVRLDRRAGRLTDVDSQLAYMRKVVVNLSQSSLRRRLVAIKHAPRPALPVAGADTPALAALEHDAMLAALAQLPTRQRQALVLRFYEELSEAETAAAMGCAVGTVKATVSQAKQSLARILGLTEER